MITEQMLLNISLFIIILYISCILTFIVWIIKLIIERYLMKKALVEGSQLSQEFDKFINYTNYCKEYFKTLETLNSEEITTEHLVLASMINKTTPRLLNYKKKLFKKIEKLSKKVDRLEIVAKNTTKVANLFLQIISFGKLSIEIR